MSPVNLIRGFGRPRLAFDAVTFGKERGDAWRLCASLHLTCTTVYPKVGLVQLSATRCSFIAIL
jgi:hypothetical protein